MLPVNVGAEDLTSSPFCGDTVAGAVTLRVLPSGVARGRSQVVAQYARQFDGKVRGYSFGDLQIKGGRAGRLYAFLDLHQSLRADPRLPSVPFQMRFPLMTNCRNTR